MIRRMFAALSRYRPRALTLFVLASTGATVALANLSEEYRRRDPSTHFPATSSPDLRFNILEADGDPSEVRSAYFRESFAQSVAEFWNISSGWPLLWRQYVLKHHGRWSVIAESYNGDRLAVNVALWLIMLAVPGALCEWLLRRYRPGFRWRLRTMLAAITLVGALCAWFTTARNRANVQDPFFSAIDGRIGCFWIERWGPKWTDYFGAQRFSRRIVGAQLYLGRDEDSAKTARRLLDELKRLPDLRYLSLYADRVSPDITDALGELPQLKALRIEIRAGTPHAGPSQAGRPRSGALRIRLGDRDLCMPRECLIALGKMDRLEHLRLAGCTIAPEHLMLLARLKKLESLLLEGVSSEPYFDAPLLSQLPGLPRLEALDLRDSRIMGRDLRSLAALPRLKSLNLLCAEINSAGLAELAPLEFLEDLTISDKVVSSDAIESLLRLKRLKTLHVEDVHAESSRRRFHNFKRPLSSNEETNDRARATEKLRKAKPELGIDGVVGSLDGCPKCETIPGKLNAAAAQEAVRVWRERQAGN